MPFTEISRIVTILVEYVSNRLLAGRQRILVPRHAFVRIAARQKRSAKRAAERKSRDIAGEIDPVDFGPLQVRSSRIRISIKRQRLCAELVAENPDYVRPLWN